MKHRILPWVPLAVAMAISAIPGMAQKSAERSDRIAKEVRHELVMLPYYGFIPANAGIEGVASGGRRQYSFFRLS